MPNNYVYQGTTFKVGDKVQTKGGAKDQKGKIDEPITGLVVAHIRRYTTDNGYTYHRVEARRGEWEYVEAVESYFMHDN